MKRLYLTAFCLFFAVNVSAQEVEVPLFNDSQPNLGRSAKPLDSIVLTPDPLPAVRISLDNTPPKKNKVISKSRPLSKKTADLKNAKTLPISVKKTKLNSEKERELADRLQIRMNRNPKSTFQGKVENVSRTRTNSSVMSDKSLEGLFGKTHDVHLFSIGGFALDMTPEEVAEIVAEKGYQVTKIEHGIPLFRTSFYEQNCRNANIRVSNEIRNCVINQALNDEVYYISSITMQKKRTREYIQILFSSNATDNVSYKIFYENKGDNSLNFTRKNLAKKQRRKEAFWNLMFETYGLPDDSEKLIWGEPQKAYMQATMQGSNYNAYIVMEDKEIMDRDYFDAKDQSADLVYQNPFTFADDFED